MIDKLFIDMDGVITNMVKPAFALFDKPVPESWPEDTWITRVMGITDEEFWCKADVEEFWSGMEWMSDGYMILRHCVEAVGIEKVHIYTSPMESPCAAAGKMKWIFKHLPQFKRRITIGCDKTVGARSDRILVDDADENIQAFIGAGGHGILVPRPWNKGRNIGLPAAEWVSLMLDRHING